MTSGGRTGRFKILAVARDGRRFFARVGLVWRNNVPRELDDTPMLVELCPRKTKTVFKRLSPTSHAKAAAKFESNS